MHLAPDLSPPRRLPLPLQGTLAAKHSASASLLEFLPNSRPNCELLGATPDRWVAWLASSSCMPSEAHALPVTWSETTRIR